MKYLIQISEDEFGIAEEDGTYMSLEEAPIGNKEIQDVISAGVVTPCKIVNGKCVFNIETFNFTVGTPLLYPNQYDQDYVISTVTSKGADFVSRKFGDYNFTIGSYDEFCKLRDSLQPKNADWKFVCDRPTPKDAVLDEEAIEESDEDPLEDVPELDFHGVADAMEDEEDDAHPLLDLDAAMEDASRAMEEAEESESETEEEPVDIEVEEEHELASQAENTPEVKEEPVETDVAYQDADTVEVEAEPEVTEVDEDPEEEQSANAAIEEEPEVVDHDDDTPAAVEEEDDPNRFVPPVVRPIPENMTLEKQIAPLTSMMIPEECRGETFAFTEDYMRAKDITDDAQCIEDNWEKRGAYWIIDVLQTGQRIIHSDKNKYSHEFPIRDCV